MRARMVVRMQHKSKAHSRNMDSPVATPASQEALSCAHSKQRDSTSTTSGSTSEAHSNAAITLLWLQLTPEMDSPPVTISFLTFRLQDLQMLLSTFSP